jgi:hypothetical protein
MNEAVTVFMWLLAIAAAMPLFVFAFEVWLGIRRRFYRLFDLEATDLVVREKLVTFWYLPTPLPM